jgi:hypothetical protein
MFSINVTPGNAVYLAQPSHGFKGFAITGSGKQVMQPLNGFKGITVEAAVNGYALKIVHYRSFTT